MATSEASAICAQKSLTETFAVQLESSILSQNGCFLREIFLLFANIWKTITVRRFSPKGNFFAELNENLQIDGKIDKIEKAISVSTQSHLVQEKIEASLTPAIRAHPFSKAGIVIYILNSFSALL
jgi:hypothetical protein